MLMYIMYLHMTKIRYNILFKVNDFFFFTKEIFLTLFTNSVPTYLT